MNLYHKMVDNSFRVAAISTISYMLATYLGVFTIHAPDQIGGLWSAISAIMALKQERDESCHAGWQRIVATFIGAVVTALVLYFIGGGSVAFFIAIFAATMVCFLSDMKELYGSACITAAVILIVWDIAGCVDDPFLFSALRFVDSLIGVVIAIIASHIPQIKISKK